jgi:hypothetical protein
MVPRPHVFFWLAVVINIFSMINSDILFAVHCGRSERRLLVDETSMLLLQ